MLLDQIDLARMVASMLGEADETLVARDPVPDGAYERTGQSFRIGRLEVSEDLVIGEPQRGVHFLHG